MAEVEHVDIAPDGDVVFICTRDPKTDKEVEVRIRVSSALVSNGSSVLKAMLRPRFKEGASLATTGSVGIPIPDDDPNAMVILLNGLHLRNHAQPSVPGMKLLLALATVVDKYDCGEAMAPIAHFWVTKWLESATTAHLPSLLLAAYHFGQPDLFEDIGQRLVFHSKFPVARDTGDLALVLNALEMKRQSEIASWLGFLQSMVGATRHGECAPQCTATQDISSRILAMLKSAGLWQAPRSSGWTRSLATAAEVPRNKHFSKWQQFDKCLSPEMEPCNLYCPAKKFGEMQGDILKEQLEARIAAIASSLPRLCLACIKAGNGIFKGEDCDHDTAFAFVTQS